MVLWVAVQGQSTLFTTRETTRLLNGRVCNSVVIHVRVWPLPELGFGWPGPTRREDRRRRGKRRRSGQGGRQTLPLVFEGTKLSVQFLKLSVLLGLKGNHLFDVLLSELV